LTGAMRAFARTQFKDAQAPSPHDTFQDPADPP
jgi:hypothetical protein